MAQLRQITEGRYQRPSMSVDAAQKEREARAREELQRLAQEYAQEAEAHAKQAEEEQTRLREELRKGNEEKEKLRSAMNEMQRLVSFRLFFFLLLLSFFGLRAIFTDACRIVIYIAKPKF